MAQHAPSSGRHPLSLGGVYSVKTELNVAFWAAFDASRHPKHSGNVHVSRRLAEELQLRVFPSLPLSLFSS